jgi:hypothetical protein
VVSDEIKRHPYFTNCVVRFEGFEGDTLKLKPQGVKRNDKILRARAELGVGLPPARFLDRFLKRRPRTVLNLDARDIVTNYRERKAGTR